MSITIHTVENGFTVHATVPVDSKLTPKTFVARNQGELIKIVKNLTKVNRGPAKPKVAKAPKAAEKTDA